MKPCRPLALALALMLVAAGCTAGSALDALPPGDGAEMASAVAERRGPVVEVLPPVAEQLPPLDPDARPATPLGALRARWFPIWTSDFDGAFPPDACGSAWELDGIARPVTDVDISLYGDARIMAALAVMRYEHLVSRALADPAPLAQLCIAVGAVDPARAEALAQLAATIQQSQPSQPSGHPDAVTILASSPSAVLAVACNSASAGDPDGASVGAYLLQVSVGIEDRVVDVSYRVAQAQHRSVAGCSALDAWASEWDDHVTAWIAEGQAWVPTRIVTTAEHICSLHSPDSPHECPQDWRP